MVAVSTAFSMADLEALESNGVDEAFLVLVDVVTVAPAKSFRVSSVKPVLRKNQGEDVGITVAQDFDFSTVYGLALK